MQQWLLIMRKFLDQLPTNCLSVQLLHLLLLSSEKEKPESEGSQVKCRAKLCKYYVCDAYRALINTYIYSGIYIYIYLYARQIVLVIRLIIRLSSATSPSKCLKSFHIKFCALALIKAENELAALQKIYIYIPQIERNNNNKSNNGQLFWSRGRKRGLARTWPTALKKCPALY